MSALAPVFWVDQDLGWRDLYCAVSDHNFMKDQAEEVARLFLGVPARHRAVDKGDFADAKATLESIKERIAVKRSTVAALRKELGVAGVRAVRDAHIELQHQREALVLQLHSHGSMLETISQSHSQVDELLSQAAAQRDAAAFALHSAQREACTFTSKRTRIERSCAEHWTLDDGAGSPGWTRVDDAGSPDVHAPVA
jgi:hypothetical protein